MNKFRANLHPALFDPKGFSESGYLDGKMYGKHNWNGNGFDAPDLEDVVVTPSKPRELEKRKAKEEREKGKKDVRERTIEDATELKTDVLQSNIRRNNESLASSTVETKEEKEQSNEEVSKQLEKQLKQLAKNKKIDLPWTDNAWKCSRSEKRLATSSAKVFQELLGGNPRKLAQMIEKCKSKNGELTDQEAEERKKQLIINSKTKDIQRFYKAFKEYQNPQSQFQHLKNLMGFFCESNFENKRDLRSVLETRSQKISRSDIERGSKVLYQEGMQDGEYVIIDNKTGEKIDRKPKDWKQRASFEIIKDRLKNENSVTNKMLTLLGDFNLDGEVNSGDVGYKTGSQLADVFRRSVATKHLEDSKFDDNAAVKNIIAYANKFGMNIQNVQTVDQLYQWMTDNKNGYENTRKIQDFLKNLSVELDDVISNGVEAGKDSLNRMMHAIDIEKDETEKVRKAATEKTKEILADNDQKFKDLIKDAAERTNLMQQLTQQLPGILVDHANNVQRGLGVGARLPLDQIIKGLSAGLHVGVDSKGNPKFGLFVGWGTKLNLSKSTDLSAAVNAGNNLLFIPCGSASLELGKDINKKSREQSLAAKGVAKVSLGGNVSITGGIFSRGVSAGFENNKKEGIEKQAKEINDVVKEKAKPRVEALKTNPNGLKDALKKTFPKATEDELNRATNNIASIIKQFKIDEKSTASDFDTYAKIIADVYAEQWRNAALTGIADNKRKISGGKLGVQFFAGFIPVPTLVTRITKNYNARTNESEYSRIAKIDAQVNGTGNKLLDLGDSKEIGENQVNQINEILKRYGAKNYLLSYSAGKDGKPGCIIIPAGVVDGTGINVRVSENLKGCVKNTGSKGLGGPWYSFPANATYRILQETGGNQKSITLNIGSDKSSMSDIMISDRAKMESLLGDKNLMGAKKLEYKDPRSESIEYKPDIDSLFTTDVIEGLKTIDSSNRRKFSEFMRTKTNAEKTFDDMLQAVINVLGKDKKYDAIKSELSVPHKDNQGKIITEVATRKQLIMDRIMAISASANVHNANGLNENLKLRKDYYKKETMKGPNGQSIFDKLNVNRDEFIKTLDGKYGLEPRQNLLGATAFYNRNNSAKGLALTGFGATNVLGGKTQELTGADKSKASEWFLGGKNEKGDYVPGVLTEKSPAEWSNLKRVLKNKLPEGASLSNENLKKLLKGEEIEFTLDNSQKKVKVKLDVKYVFYLMGECANESVGIELGSLQVQEQHEVDDYSQGSLYLNSGEGTNVVSVSGRDVAVGVTVGLGEKNKSKQPENTEVKTGDATQGGKSPNTVPSGTTPVVTPPTPAGGGTDDKGGNHEI